MISGLERGATFDQKVRLFNSCTQGLVAHLAPTLVASKATLSKTEKLQIDCIADCVPWRKSDAKPWLEWSKAKRKYAASQM